MGANVPSELMWGWALASVTPPWVADAGGGAEFARGGELGEGIDAADLLDHRDLPLLEGGDAGGVIAAVLHAREAFEGGC